jgi:hypothetical protein
MIRGGELGWKNGRVGGRRIGGRDIGGRIRS